MKLPMAARSAFSTSTVIDSQYLVPWLSAKGPLAYSPTRPPVRDHFFQYTCILPGIFNLQGQSAPASLLRQPPQEQRTFLFGFWANARRGDGSALRRYCQLGFFSDNELLEELAAENDRKIVIFSEWTTMLTLIERQIKPLKLDCVRLDGSVPQKKRQQLVHQFPRDPTCRVFLTTNAGSMGLNLQAANTVINVDLPSNPAILEQRIARAHRMGQKNPVQVYLLMSEGTIEEKLLATLSAKHDLALAALDMESNVREVAPASGIARGPRPG